jgi:hypothetical protein
MTLLGNDRRMRFTQIEGTEWTPIDYAINRLRIALSTPTGPTTEEEFTQRIEAIVNEHTVDEREVLTKLASQLRENFPGIDRRANTPALKRALRG